MRGMGTYPHICAGGSWSAGGRRRGALILHLVDEHVSFMNNETESHGPTNRVSLHTKLV